MKKLLTILAMILMVLPALAQERRLQNRPYIDQRRLHWGFLFGFHMQDIEFKNNGRVDPQTGEQWYADVDNYSPGFSVGVLGEMKMTEHLALRLSPTMHFGQKRAWFHEQVSGQDTTYVMKGTYMSFPLDVKFSAPRYNNFRPYLIAGFVPSIDLSTRKHHTLLAKQMDCCLEFGMGCDIYLKFFKLNPELKFSFGLTDILKHDRTDLIDNMLTKYTNSLDKGRTKMITLVLNFE